MTKIDLIEKYNLKIGDLLEIRNEKYEILIGVFYAFTENYIFITADEISGCTINSPFKLYKGSYAISRDVNYKIKKIDKINININFLKKKYA